MSQQQILMLGAYGQNNLGDDGLIEVCLAQFRSTRLVLNSDQPAQAQRRWPTFRHLLAIYRADAVVFGGGSLLAAVEGGPITGLLSFLRIFMVLIVARLLGRPSAMLGIGVGPLRHPTARRLAARVVGLADLIVVRDQAAHDLLVSLGVRRSNIVAADLAFSSGADAASTAVSEPQPTSVPPQVGQLRGRSQESVARFVELMSRPRQGGALSGGALLLASMTIVNAGNYLFNLLLGRWLGPAAFADLSLIITAFLIVTLITATLQTISAKFTAIHVAAGEAAQVRALRTWLGAWAWGLGGASFALFALGAPFWQHFFHTTSAWPFVILGIGLPFYYAQGIDRGVLQGATRFPVLALSYQVEMWARLIFAVALVGLGWSVNGAVAGVTLSLVAAWLAAARPLGGLPRGAGGGLTPGQRRAISAFVGPVAAALVGQVLINNSDILIVKHFFPSADAGQYAALALIGRVVFFATLSVVAAMFPLAAQRQQRGEPHRQLLWMSLGLVAASSLAVIGAALLFPELLVGILFGAAYLPITPLLWLYAAATMFYALANVVINYHLAIGNSGGSVIVVAAGLAQVGGLWLFHTSLYQVVVVQALLMATLLAALLVWDWQLARRQAEADRIAAPPAP